MNQECHHRPEDRLPLPPNYQSDGSFISSLQPDFQMQSSFDGLARPQLDQQNLVTTYSSLPSNFNIYNSATSMPFSHDLADWGSSAVQLQYERDSHYGYNTADLSYLRNTPQETPRTPYPQYGEGLLIDNDVPSIAFNSPYYGLEPVGGEMQTPGLTCDAVDARGMSRLNIFQSPKLESDNFGATHFALHESVHHSQLLSEGSDDGGHSSHEMTGVEIEDPGTDGPYAKLIWRALMSVPDHSMVLQEIYKWFRKNTNKGSSDSKGWMNSIRHNLSMNAVRYLINLLESKLTYYRLLGRQSGKFQETRRRSLQNGFLKTLRSEMACNLRQDTAKELALRSSSNQETQHHLGRYQAAKGGTRRTSSRDKDCRLTGTVRVLDDRQ
jgi:hypothetical protein